MSDKIAQLKQEIISLNIQLKEYKQSYELIKQQLDDLRRHRFGTRSERYCDIDAPQQLSLFDEPTSEVQPTEMPSAEVDVPAHKRRVKRKKDTSNYPRTIEIIEVPEADKTCACGCRKKVIRYETKELFDYQPAVFSIVEQRREVVACPHQCQGQINTAPKPAHILPKAKVTENLLAHIIVSKFLHRNPLYHLEKYVQQIDISRQTMARWLIQLVPQLQPMFNLLKDNLIDYDVASIDATTLQVLKEPGRKAVTKSYLYCIRGGPPDKSVVLYEYNATQHKHFVDKTLEGFAGHIHMDADNFFDKLTEDDNVTAVFCMAHARRYFEKITKRVKKQGLSHQAVRYIKQLYRVEREAKDNALSPQQRYQLRLEKTKPILDEFQKWLDDNVNHLVPDSPLEKAFNYCIKHWQGLIAFLSDGRLEIDNNLTEQQIKPLVILRKNFLFANSVQGAHAIGMHASIIRTALAHNVEPYAYYVHILKNIPMCQTADDFAELLPWNCKSLIK